MAIYSPSAQEAIRINLNYQLYKRILDIVVIVLLLPVLLLVSLGVIVLIRLDSEGPLLFKQKRVGRNGVEFTMYKFRSMLVNADEAVHRKAIKLYLNGGVLNNGTSEHVYKLADDSRVTRIGRFIRKTSLDEVPQFINVLRGEMSIVGPRPPTSYEVEDYAPRDLLRLCGKPGLTGPWQVYGRSRVPFAEMVEMDIAYLQRQAILQDLKLMALTLPVILFGRGGG